MSSEHLSGTCPDCGHLWADHHERDGCGVCAMNYTRACTQWPAHNGRHRPESGRLLPRHDPRVVAATAATRCLGAFDWRDVAEVVNAVLEADDRIHSEESA